MDTSFVDMNTVLYLDFTNGNTCWVLIDLSVTYQPAGDNWPGPPAGVAEGQ